MADEEDETRGDGDDIPWRQAPQSKAESKLEEDWSYRPRRQPHQRPTTSMASF